MEPQRKRSPNFSQQDCLLLAELMGETHPNFKDIPLSFHQVDKHRFSQRITSSTKKSAWTSVCNKFNSSANFPRTATDLQKKWENLVIKHRNLYMDYKRSLAMTGSAPSGEKLSLLTETIMNVIGKENTNVSGVSGTHTMDSTLAMLPSLMPKNTQPPTASGVEGGILSSNNPTFEPLELALDRHHEARGNGSGSKTRCHCSCEVDQEIVQLKKQKLKLQIKYLTKKLEQ